MNEKILTDYKTALAKAGAISIIPSGNSMWPTLKHKGQSVLIEGKKGRLQPLDVALYSADGKYVLHRVLKVEDNCYITCGDAMNVLEKVPEENVIGKMVGFYKGKEFVSCTDEDYVKKVKNWYKRRKLRKCRLFFFHVRLRIKGVARKIFKGKK